MLAAVPKWVTETAAPIAVAATVYAEQSGLQLGPVGQQDPVAVESKTIETV